MSADAGQGLHPYWKWAYATGFNDAKRLLSASPAAPIDNGDLANAASDLLEVLDGVNLEGVVLPARFVFLETRKEALRALIPSTQL
jgi:hypothetical protein